MPNVKPCQTSTFLRLLLQHVSSRRVGDVFPVRGDVSGRLEIGGLLPELVEELELQDAEEVEDDGR